MPDSRFFEDLGPASLVELAALSGATLARAEEGDRRVAAVAPLGRGDAASIGFFADRRYLADLKATLSGACFVSPEQAEFAPEGCAALLTAQPQAAYAKAADRLHRARRMSAADPAIHPTAELEDDVTLAPGVLIGAGAKIGRGTSIGAYSVIGPGCAIGRGCTISSQVTIGFALIGDRVRILAGAVIGEPGFGVTTGDGKTVDIPQLGRVIIQDNVSIGSCTCIDRGAWDDTVIGENTKIDNQVQIAHNVQIGRGCLLAAQTGISGSVKVGDGVAFGGGAGIADHLTIGDRARIAADAGVMRDVPAGEMWVGAPARPLRRFMREMAWLAKMANARGGTDK
jgi:UDP-3-O-[3-hydroxymyristoyl] glucosamine N-acyltransferase